MFQHNSCFFLHFVNFYANSNLIQQCLVDNKQFHSPAKRFSGILNFELVRLSSHETVDVISIKRQSFEMPSFHRNWHCKCGIEQLCVLYNLLSYLHQLWHIRDSISHSVGWYIHPLVTQCEDTPKGHLLALLPLLTRTRLMLSCVRPCLVLAQHRPCFYSMFICLIFFA